MAKAKKILTALQGWKLVIGVLVVFGVKVYDGLHGTRYAGLTDVLLGVFGWTPTGLDPTEAVGPAIVLIGIAGKLIRAHQQIKAGSSLSGALGTEGHLVLHEIDLLAGKPEAIAVEQKAMEAVEKATEPEE